MTWSDHLFILLAFLGCALMLARFYRYLVDAPEQQEPEAVDDQAERKQRALQAANRGLP